MDTALTTIHGPSEVEIKYQDTGRFSGDAEKLQEWKDERRKDW